jgi:hypothetical protein
LPVRLWLRGKPAAPPPETARPEQRHQNYANNRNPDNPTNSELGNQDKDSQQDNACDYEDSGEGHLKSVTSGQWSVVRK